MSSKGSILLTGGTGKVARRIAPLFSSNGNTVLIASRSGKCPPLANATGVKFDWFDSTTYTNPFSHSHINAIFLVAPPIIDCFPPMKAFIDLAVEKGVKRFVLLSASVLDVGDGPMMGQVSKYISSLRMEWAVLRPTWFMGELPPSPFPTTSSHPATTLLIVLQRISPKCNTCSQLEMKIRSLQQQEKAKFRSCLRTMLLLSRFAHSRMRYRITRIT